VHGFEAALERAHAFVAAGVDATFVEAPVSTEELARIARSLSVPQVANMVFGGLTPAVPQGGATVPCSTPTPPCRPR
jgi:2-methylisocitrate lyase-like PEP mutase family enzyme